MPNWLKGMIGPTLVLWLFLLSYSVASAAWVYDGGLPSRADLAARAGFAVVMAYWVLADARKRGRRLCYDYGSFLFFAWPVLLPVYLFQTRGVRAFLTLLCFAGICLVAMIVGAVMGILRMLAHSMGN